MSSQSVCTVASLVLICAALITGCAGGTRALHGSVYNPPQAAPAINLQTTSGTSFKLSSFKGDILLLYFGYTFCPDVCPTTLADVKLIFEEIGQHAEDIHLAMITVDPERDTPEVLNDYLRRFHPQYIGLRGQGEQLDQVMSAYGVFAQKDPSHDPDRYLVSHTARLFLIDQQGVLRTNYPFGAPRETILADINLLLQEGLPE